VNIHVSRLLTIRRAEPQCASNVPHVVDPEQLFVDYKLRQTSIDHVLGKESDDVTDLDS